MGAFREIQSLRLQGGLITEAAHLSKKPFLSEEAWSLLSHLKHSRRPPTAQSSLLTGRE